MIYMQITNISDWFEYKCAQSVLDIMMSDNRVYYNLCVYYYYFVFIWIAGSLDHNFGWELHFVMFRPLSSYVVFSWSFFIIFVILLAVSFTSFRSSV